MTVHASDVAAELRTRFGARVNPVQLHKLLYLCQAWHAVWTDEPLFVESIEAWDNGPVVAELWRAEKYRFPAVSSPESMGDTGIATIDYVVTRYGHLTPNELIEFTHKDGPWCDAFDRGRNSRIKVDEMIQHFSQDEAADQAWFWHPDWQAGEREADQDIRNGRVTHYSSVDEFIASL